MAEKPIAIAQLRERVRIEEEQTVDNGRGGRTKSWEEVETVWAEVIPLRGDEALSQGIQRGVQLYRVTVRYGSTVTIKHRLAWRGVTMDIRTAAPNVLRDGIVMTAESGNVG